MFEKYDVKAIKAIMLAQEESRRLGHNYVGTEQLLLALIGEGEGIAAQALKSLGLDLRNTRVEVESAIGRGSGCVALQIPFTPQAKQVLSFAKEEAFELGHDYLGTEHLLLGLIRVEASVGMKVMTNLGVKPVVVREKVMEILGREPVESPRQRTNYADPARRIATDTRWLLRSIDNTILKIERDFNNLKFDLAALRGRILQEDDEEISLSSLMRRLRWMEGHEREQDIELDRIKLPQERENSMEITTLGQEESRIEWQRAVVIKLLTRKLGNLSPELFARLDSLNLDLLEALTEELLDFTSVGDLESWLDR